MPVDPPVITLSIAADHAFFASEVLATLRAQAQPDDPKSQITLFYGFMMLLFVTAQSHPNLTMQTIQEHTGLHRHTILRYYKDLEAKGLLIRDQITNSLGEGHTHAYRFTPELLARVARLKKLNATK
jgi:HTH domain